jgi:selT/selW/selH-like putative selenoprotein
VAEEVKEAFDVEVEFLKGFENSFEVILNGETIYSKLKEGELPKSGEIVQLIEEYLNSGS